MHVEVWGSPPSGLHINDFGVISGVVGEMQMLSSIKVHVSFWVKLC